MSGIRRTAATLGLALAFGIPALVVGSRVALAQETTGRVVGLVADQTSGTPLSGVTVIVQGPQGEDATITDEAGQYSFSSLPVGTYTIRYYLANTSTQVEQTGVRVSAEKTVRVNAKIATTAQAAAQQTYVITGKAPTVDVGSARIGTTFDEDFTLNLALNPNYGSIISKAPGAFVDASGNVSIGGATGLENTYIVNGVNVTGLRYGNLEAGTASIGGGTNLPTEFLTQIDVNSGGYQAEYGGALGGVINTVLKSGSNQYHGSVFTSYAPYWLAADPRVVTQIGSSLSGVRKPDFDDRLGFEVGGPLIKDKLFFWLGVAPQLTDSHIHRFATAFEDDGTGSPKADANGNLIMHALPDATRRLNETHRAYSYAATINYIPAPDHKLELALFGTPSFNNELRSFGNGSELNAAFPTGTGSTWPQEALTKTNTDATLHWTSKLADRHFTLEAIGGFHDEYMYQRSPDPALNQLNQLEYNNTNLWDREQLAGCDPAAGRLCPVKPFYSAGGFGNVQKYSGQRWSGEVKGTNVFELGGRNELKYGWHLDLSKLDLTRYYSGPPGAHGLVWFDSGNANSQNYFGLPSNRYPGDYFDANGGPTRFPTSDLVQNPLYTDQLRAQVKSLSNAFFLQETFSPSGLRNLSLNAGVRYELQKVYDAGGGAFLNADNLAPRFGAVFDPFNDGRSKISASYGRYFEAVPLDLAARYFGGENWVDRYNIPPNSCANQDINTWTGAGEWRQCAIPPPGNPMGVKDAASGYQVVNNTAQKQSHIQGQYQNEVVASVEREIMEDMTARIDYTHRWMGTVIEDGYGDATFTDVLGNPGHVPSQALTDAQTNATTLHAQADADQMAADGLAAMAKADPTNKTLATQAADASSKAANTASQAVNADRINTTLQGLAKDPKPERTYDALSLTINKRFSKNWLVRGSYTYSRLVGNYEGLFQTEQLYYAPNASNAYDLPDFIVNSRGLLPNDHPHQGKLDGFYSVEAGPGKFTFGLSFFARSGMPRNTIGAYYPANGNQLEFILPRGSAGRTPTITQFDGHIAYAQKVKHDVTLEAYIDLFNFLNQRATLMTDDNYTYDAVAPVENGTKKDLLFAKAFDGSPINKNKNYGQATAYQAPFYTRLGLRLMF